MNKQLFTKAEVEAAMYDPEEVPGWNEAPVLSRLGVSENGRDIMLLYKMIDKKLYIISCDFV